MRSSSPMLTTSCAVGGRQVVPLPTVRVRRHGSRVGPRAPTYDSALLKTSFPRRPTFRRWASLPEGAASKSAISRCFATSTTSPSIIKACPSGYVLHLGIRVATQSGESGGLAEQFAEMNRRPCSDIVLKPRNAAHPEKDQFFVLGDNSAECRWPALGRRAVGRAGTAHRQGPLHLLAAWLADPLLPLPFNSVPISKDAPRSIRFALDRVAQAQRRPTRTLEIGGLSPRSMPPYRPMERFPCLKSKDW